MAATSTRALEARENVGQLERTIPQAHSEAGTKSTIWSWLSRNWWVKPPAPQAHSEADTKSTVRPWLYGNWWVLKPPAPRGGWVFDSLIGVGVRLTEWPERHNCQIYKTEVTHYRGSSLRVLTDDGRLSNTQNRENDHSRH
jgi:hypothetical protein